MTPETLPEDDDWVFFAVTPQDYESLSLNYADFLRWAQEAQWRFDYYRGELDSQQPPPEQ